MNLSLREAASPGFAEPPVAVTLSDRRRELADTFSRAGKNVRTAREPGPAAPPIEAAGNRQK